MKQKRKSLVCVQCSKRKVKCDKNIPCNNCIRRHVAHLCRRPFKAENIYEKIESITNKMNGNVLENRSENSASSEALRDGTKMQSNEETGVNYNVQLSQNHSLLSNGSIENYMLSVRSLTFGLSHMNGLLPADNTHQSLENEREGEEQFKKFMQKLKYEQSYLICAFACKYTTLLHYGVVDHLFMEDHAKFWESLPETSSIPDCTLWDLYSNLKSKEGDIRDFQYWMSLYMTMLCVGIYFGMENLKDKLAYTDAELEKLPHVLFRESFKWLEKTDFLERPDIRTIQIYCVMTSCLHALGNVFIHHELLAVVIVVAQTLGLDRIEEQGITSGNNRKQGAVNSGSPDIIAFAEETTNSCVNFSSEVVKRLWYSFFIIDSISNVPHEWIGKFKTPFPKLISTEQLISCGTNRIGARHEKYYYGSTKNVAVKFPTAGDDIAGLLYERLMVQLGELKQESYTDPVTLKRLTVVWSHMCTLKDNLEMYFGSAPYSPKDDRTCQYARYLLFSSLARECLGLGARILTLAGRDFWLENFRDKCLQLALEVVDHNSASNVPAYYKRYWIVGQHLIYACLFVLLDMLMFKHEECKENLQRIHKAIPTIRLLRSTHYTVKIGLAVIEKLYYLVGSVRLGNKGSGSVEDMSLREFLTELQVANPRNTTSKKATHTSGEEQQEHQSSSINSGIPSLMPLPGYSQYLRGGVASERSSNKNIELRMDNATISTGTASFLDSDLDSALDETGWKEFLEFFFGSHDEVNLQGSKNGYYNLEPKFGTNEFSRQ